MSLFSIQINFEKSKAPKDLLRNISTILADSFSQHIDNISGSLVDNVHLSWRGNTDALLFLNIQTIRDLNAELNQSCSVALYKYLTNALNLSEDRIIIYFTEKVLSDVAIDGSLLIQCA